MTLTRGAAHGNYRQRARAAFLDLCGEPAATKREREIAGLPQKRWKGTQVYRLECDGGGYGTPHEMWVPEHVLWMLISLNHFHCPYH